MALNALEKARIRYHLGYPNVQAGPGMIAGMPITLQPMFLLERAMDLVIPEIIPQIRSIIQIMDDLEQQLVDTQGILVADQLEELILAGAGDGRSRLATDRQDNEYYRWGKRLADIFSVAPYPFSQRYDGQPGSRSGTVRVRN